MQVIPGKKHENHCPVPKGALVLVGGKENKDEDIPETKRNLQIL